MSQQFLKNLECFCIKEASTTCPAGGFIDATMTLKEGSLTADVKSEDSKLSSPGRELSCTSTDVDIVGDGPYYDVTINTSTENILGACDFIEEGWRLVVSRVNLEGTQFEYYDVKRENSDGSVLVFGLSKFILESGLTFKFEGVGLITPPDATVAKAVDQLLEATSEIDSQLSGYLSIKPDEQLLEKGTKHDFRFSGSATNVDGEIIKIFPTDWYTGDNPNYVYDLIKRNDKNATVTLYQLFLGQPLNVIFSAPFVDFIEGGFTVKAGSIPSILDDLPNFPYYWFSIEIDDQFANTVMNEGGILPDLTAAYSVKEHLVAPSTLDPGFTDKVAGDFGLFECEQKLFPSGDRVIQDGFGSFIGPSKEKSNLFTFIDEGVFDGRMQDKKDASTLSDGKDSFIVPDSVHTEGLFQYKCNLTDFAVRPDHTRLHMRIAAPLHNYESRIAPLYTVYNINFLDPSGNLVVKYKDFSLRGDAADRNNNFATYSTAPETNLFTDYYDWNRPEKAHLYEGSGYSLSFSVRAVALDDPFDPGFNKGFEENFILPDIVTDEDGNNYLALDGAPLSTQETRFINPTDAFRVSAVEICNSGGLGPRREQYLPIHIRVPTKGRRVEQDFLPNFMPLSNFDSTLWPSVSSVWSWSSDASVTNINKCNAETMVRAIKQNSSAQYITMDSAQGGGVADSGKLTLKFSNQKSQVKDISKGAFNIAFDQGTKNTWWKPSGAFNVENSVNTQHKDLSFFSVDTLTLKVLAKKQVGTRDYVLDVVGYSDDKLLSRTPASGGFIQDPSGIHLNDLIVTQQGHYPVISGFNGNSDQLALGGRALSEKEDFFTSSGNDHFKLTQYPVVTGTDFELYEVPLKINSNSDKLGLPRDYTLSSLLEHVYLDIFPLPSGASIAHIALSVRYNPQDGLNMSTYGGPIGRTIDGRTDAAMFPAAMGPLDSILNAGSGYAPLSRILDIPHSYRTPKTIKTNYARRWRGAEGTVRGPYDPDSFSFGFENPVIDYPFLSGYFKFDQINGKYVQSSNLGPRDIPSGLGTLSGLMVGSPDIYHNIGWRFASGTLFQQQLPGYSGNYTTTDWTSLSKGAFNFVGDPMYGKIADAFDRTVRVSGVRSNINFGNIDTTSGFAIFTRFTPDASVSGQSHNLFNSGVLFAKWNTPSELDFALGYKDGFLCAYAKNDDDNSIVQVIDTIPYSGYVYPLNVLLTYNDNQSSGLKLYVDGENYFGDYESGDFDPSYDAPHLLRAASNKFYKKSTNGNLTLGWGAGSGVGMNMLVSEFGVSTWSSGVNTLYGSGTNIVESNADRTYKQVTAEDFFNNLRVTFFNSGVPYGNDQFRLWDRVNEDTHNDWQIGDFKYCEFSTAFDQWQKRPNREQIIFDIKHHGSGYSSRNDLSLPSSVDPKVSYHTQIENDFLRFHLSDVPDHFYSANRRITKSLPTGYKFSEKALVVESVIQHNTDYSIIWPHCDAKEGPRLIVSLYSKKQDPYWTEDEPNWGLVNRKIHNIEPSSCVMRLDTTFTYGDLIDTDEEWAIFPQEPRQTEFKEKYFSEDVNDMFVQYDLVYPSGRAFESKIQLHSSHTRMSNANVLSRATLGSGSLYTFGAFPSSGDLNLVIPNIPFSGSGFLNLGLNVPIPVDVNVPSGLPLNVSGQYVERGFMALYTPEFNRQGYLNLVGPPSGKLTPSSGTLNFSMPATLDRISLGDDSVKNKYLTYPTGFTTSEMASEEATKLGLSGSHQDSSNGPFFPGARSDWDENGDSYPDESRIRGPYVPLFILNTDDPKLDQLNLFTFAVGSGSGIRGMLNLALHNDLPNQKEGLASGSLNLDVIGVPVFKTIRQSKQMPLFIDAPNIISGVLPLVVGFNEVKIPHSGEMNLYTASYTVGSKGIGSAYGMWNNNNFGTGIEVEDDYIAKIAASNEIRGVSLFGFGSCTGNSPTKAIDKALMTDETKWRPETCNDGGIFRATSTYTNSGARNFSGDLGYSGNYYGIRKYTQLLASRPYFAELTIKTGSSDAIEVPRNFEEWEYGMCGPDWLYDSGCCTADCDQNLMFSGVKLIGDDACGVPPSSNICVDPALIVSSGRNINDKYGYRVSVKGDLMAVSAPKITIPEYDKHRVGGGGYVGVPSGGAVFLYRRGSDVAGKKAGWQLEEQLMLPTGFRKDYIEFTVQDLLKFDNFTISGSKWQIGQEGREFGSALDMAVSGDTETIVVGAPRAGWTRQFNEITTSGVPCGTMVVADLFEYSPSPIGQIAARAKRFDILWKYFSAPWYGDCDLGCLPHSQQFYPHIEMKTIILQTTFAHKNYPIITKDNSSFVHKYIGRLDDFDLLVSMGKEKLGGIGNDSEFFRAGLPVLFNEMVSGVKDAFVEAFPYNTKLLYDGTPALFGMFKEDSGSTAGALQYTGQDGVVHSLYDEFEKFYNEYTFESGVYDQTTNLKASGHLNTILGVSEDWATTTIELINDTFDSGRLSKTKTNDTLNRDFITSGVGQEWGNSKSYDITQFQIPPQSGGRVYVFEKERDNFNCVQIITSPSDINDFRTLDEGALESEGSELWGWKQYNDRFGHSVGISHNSEVLSIGSPFIKDSCRIYEKDADEQSRVYSSLSGWLVTESKNSTISHFHKISLESGVKKAQESAYDFMTASERMRFRIDIDSKPYKLSYKYGYGNIKYVGTNQFLPEEFAPTSRLGWSTSVSDDGSSVGFGAPTDSFNEFEDVNVWAESIDSWASYQNAGAVRMFEARKTFDHSSVIEFGRFGNLDRSTHPTERSKGYYDQMGLYFNLDTPLDERLENLTFRRTDFSEIEIPRDAGLAFIITPEIDAASDEIIENIKNWLVLGDRNLVLVGNDPTWEENGLYSDSNDVINKILEKLGSRMRITAAKNKEMSLQGCVSEQDKLDNKYNITKSKQPAHTTGSTSLRGNFYAKGVGDIRINIERDGYANFKSYMDCPEGEDCEGGRFIVNDKCEFPLMNSGDLRAEWSDTCLKIEPKCRVVHYKQNWPLHFANYTPNCTYPPTQIIKAPNFEPVPVLTTAEHLPPKIITYPETSGFSSEFKYIYEDVITDKFKPFVEFSGGGDKYLNFEVMSIQEDSNSDPAGKFNSFSINELTDPSLKNGRDGLVQGVAKSYDSDKPITYSKKELYRPSILAVAESGTTDTGSLNNSKAYLIATQWPEDDGGRGLSFKTTNKDKNTEFYINIVKNDCDEVPRGIHLGGWTGNTSLQDAYYLGGTIDSSDSQHSLAQKFSAEFQGRGEDGYFKENVILLADAEIDPQINFIWIANPENTPPERDISKIKRWMNKGNKRLIITYSAAARSIEQLYARNVDYICEKLNISSRPFFVPSDGEYFVVPSNGWDNKKNKETKGLSTWINTGDTITPSLQLTDTSTEALSGCDDGYGFTTAYNRSTAASGLSVSKDTMDYWRAYAGKQPEDHEFGEGLRTLRNFVPISGGTNYEKIVWFDYPITTLIPNIPKPLWKITGESVIKFPTIPLSGYKLFLHWVSETNREDKPLRVEIEDVNIQPRACDYFPLHEDCKDVDPDDDNDYGFTFGKDLTQTPVMNPQEDHEINFVAKGEEVTIKIFCHEGGVIQGDPLVPDTTPKTVRLLSVSGCPIPLESGINYKRTIGKKLVDVIEHNKKWTIIPSYDVVIPGISRPVMHKSHDYCRPNPPEKDAGCTHFGNVLIEDGPVVVAEEFENFSSFPNGKRRSKITLIADSTMIQGECPHYRSESSAGNQEFIRSLYPPRPRLVVTDESRRDLHEFDIDLMSSEDDLESISTQGRNFYFSQKLRGPERGSPAKYHAASGAAIGDTMIEPLYTLGGIDGSLDTFYDNEDTYDPADVVRPKQITQEDQIKEKKRTWGNSAKSNYGIYPRFSGDFLNYVQVGPPKRDYSDWPTNPLGIPNNKERDYILDAGIGGGLPELMKLNNTDYLDLDIYNSGCLGDLFGYSLDLSQNKLLIGSPFNGFVSSGTSTSGIVQWSEIKTSKPSDGLELAEDGGGGAVFYFEKTTSGENILVEFLPWEFIQKIKPSSVNVGIYDFGSSAAVALTQQRGSHSIDDATFINDYGKKSDNFGLSVSVDADMIAVGAPNHDYGTLHHHIYSGVIHENGLSTAFQRKSFNAEYDIPQHSFYDLGDSGIRVDKFDNLSGTMVLNNGAIFNFRHELVDFPSRTKKWIFAEKLYSQGYNDRGQRDYEPKFGSPGEYVVSQSGTENDRFGWSVCIDRAKRGDGDYTLIGGAPYHDWPTSGNHPTSGLDNAGSAYTFDAMLRGQTPSIPNEGSWMDVHVFAQKVDAAENLFKRVYQNVDGDSIEYKVSGTIITNHNGDVFLEVSGFDPSTKGFVAHRPYVDSVKFVLATGNPASGSMNLNISGSPVITTGNMNLMLSGAPSANVYNSVNLRQFGVIGSRPSGMFKGKPSGMNLFMAVPSGYESGILNLNLTSTQTTGNLDLNIRGY